MNEILTAKEVAEDLRCSKAQVYKLMNGEIADRTVLPHIALGRKKVVRRSSLEAWKRLNENRCHSLGRLRNEGRGRCELRSHMRQRFQNGCVRKSKDGYWVGQWREMTNEDRVNHHIVAEFGKRELRSLSRDDLQRFLDSKSSLSFSTVDHLRWDLKQILDMAVAEGIVRQHPALILFTPRQCARPEHPTLSMKEVKKVCDALNLRERLIVKLAVLAGMRPGEISGLRRGQIGESSAAIEQRVYRGTIDRPKANKSKRFAALSSGLRVDMEAWLGRDPEGQPSDWLFPSEKLTTPLAKDNAMHRNIRPALKTIGFDWVDFHVLRRTHASLMRELGVDPKVVADQQGHTLDVNLKVYTETSLARRREAP